MSDQYWFNGQLTANVPAANRGLAYGDGVFETILLVRGNAPLWQWHMARFRAGLATLSLDLGDIPGLHECLDAAKSQPMAVLKLTAFRTGVAAGYNPASDAADVLLSLRSYRSKSNTALSVEFGQTPLGSDPYTAGVKHLNRLPQVLAAKEAQRRGLDELVLLNSDGELVECISSNVFLLLDEQWCTPPLAAAGVSGVMREWLLANRSHWAERPVQVVTITAEQALRANAGFLCNAVRGIMPIGQLEAQAFACTESDAIQHKVQQFLHA